MAVDSAAVDSETAVEVAVVEAAGWAAAEEGEEEEARAATATSAEAEAEARAAGRLGTATLAVVVVKGVEVEMVGWGEAGVAETAAAEMVE